MASASRPVFVDHWRAFLSGSVLSITRLLAGFVRIKYIALVLGTSGVGFLSQATQVQLLGIAIGSMSMAVGIITRMGAIGADRPNRERELLSTAFTIQTTISLVLLVVSVVFSRPLANLIFGADALAESPVTSLDLLAVVCSIPLAVIASGFLEAIFFGAGRYDLYVRASVWATVLGFSATLILVWFWRLPGALWSYLAAAAFLLAAFLVHVRRVLLDFVFRIGFSAAEANALIRFSIAILVSGALIPAARLWIQRRVIASLGIDANGLLQVPFAVTGYYTPFLTNALWGRMHPAVTRVGPTPEGRRELTTALRLTVTMASAAIVSILFLKDLLVPLAYSRAFLPAARLLPMQLFGDFFYFVAFPFVVYALGISRLRVYLAVWVTYAVVAIVASLALIPSLGLVGIPVGYGISNALGAAVALGWLLSRRDEDLTTTLAVVAAGFVAVSVEAFLAWRDSYYLLQACVCGATIAVAVAGVWGGRRAGQ